MIDTKEAVQLICERLKPPQYPRVVLAFQTLERWDRLSSAARRCHKERLLYMNAWVLLNSLLRFGVPWADPLDPIPDIQAGVAFPGGVPDDVKEAADHDATHEEDWKGSTIKANEVPIGKTPPVRV